MTLLDISKIKNNEGGQESKPAPASTPKPQAQTQPQQTPPETKKTESTSSQSTNTQNQNTDKISKLVEEGISLTKTDKASAEKKYEEIQNLYAELSKEEKSKKYDECMKLFNALK